VPPFPLHRKGSWTRRARFGGETAISRKSLGLGPMRTELAQVRLWCLEPPAARYPGRVPLATITNMPFKFTAGSPSPHSEGRYGVRNWPEYEAGLTRRGDLTLWIDEVAISGRQAPQANDARRSARIWRSNWC
jgi:hypothetical protein